MESEPWYEFARIQVNAVSHNFKYEFREHEKKTLPISYKGEKITLDMDGKNVTLKLQTAFELVEDIIKFVENF